MLYSELITYNDELLSTLYSIFYVEKNRIRKIVHFERVFDTTIRMAVYVNYVFMQKEYFSSYLSLSSSIDVHLHFYPLLLTSIHLRFKQSISSQCR